MKVKYDIVFALCINFFSYLRQMKKSQSTKKKNDAFLSHLKKTSVFCRNPTMVFEGQEKEDFWTCLGGKKPYSSDKRLAVIYCR